MPRPIALRLESGAMTSSSMPSSSTSAQRAACSPGAEMPSSLVRRMRTDPILGVGDTAAVTTVRLDIEYDGARFRGWARQPGLRTVQGELETALATVLREPVELTVAGRTDTGVHALKQVASFDSPTEPPQDLTRRLNGLCPDDVAVTAATDAADGFNARRDAKARSYRYRLLARSSPSPFEQGKALWWPPGRPRGSRRLRRRPPRHARLHRLHPHPNRPRPLRARHHRRLLGARRRHHQLPNNRRRLHAKHG